MLYEILVLTSVCWNALDRPRSNKSQLTLSLHEDGLTFFAVGLFSFNAVFPELNVMGFIIGFDSFADI